MSEDKRACPFLRENREVLSLIGAFTTIRLLVAPTFGLGVDEAHYVLYGLHLDWSYLDHPPLTGWVHFLFHLLFGEGEFIARLPAMAIFAVISYLVYHYTYQLSRAKATALWAVVAVNSSFILSALGIMLLPETILLLLIFPYLAVVLRIEAFGRLGDYLLLGAVLGLAGLTKYTAVLLLPPLFIYLLLKRRYDLIISGKMVAAGLIGLLFIVPVIYWNLQHDFISFRYQSERVLASRSPEVLRFLTAWAAQFGAYSPFLFLVSIYGFVKAVFSKDDYLLLSALTGGTIAVFFSYSSFYETALPHWSALFYLLFIPVGVHFFRIKPGRFKRYFLNFAIYFSLAVTLFVYTVLGTKFITFPDYQSPFRDIYGYDLIAAEADKILKANNTEKKALATTEWTMASRLMYYSLKYGNGVFVLDQRQDQFDLWQKEGPDGYDLLLINSHFSDPFDLKRCAESKEVGGLELVMGGGKVDSIRFVWCYKYNQKR